MKSLTTTFLFCLLSFYTHSQTFEWIFNERVNYSLNPTYLEYAVDYDHFTDRIVHTQLDSFVQVFGTSLLGRYIIESRDTIGNSVWEFSIGNMAEVNRLAFDPVGNAYVGGRFQQTLYFSNGDSLEYISGGLSNHNLFLIYLNQNGAMLWKRNLSATWPDYEHLDAVSVTPTKRGWYAVSDFFQTKLFEVDVAGNDVTGHTIINAKSVGEISFDPWSGMYVSGSAESGLFIMDSDTFYAPHTYNMFLARFDTLGQPSWVHFGHDITFQRPVVAADQSGNAYFAATRYDSTTFNGAHIPAPAFMGDFFAFKADSSGSVLWTLNQPPLIIGPFGTFETGSNIYVDTDASGKMYLGGVQRGTVDWGNGYTSSTTGLTDRKSAIACVDSAGNTEWVKLGGSTDGNYIHALTVSNAGSCYFTGVFKDTATFDFHYLPTSDPISFLLGKIRILPVSVPDNETLHTVNVYPNPAKDVLNYSDRNAWNLVRIYDAIGKLVLEVNNASAGSVDISSLVKGNYVIHFTDGVNYSYEKFVKVE